MIPSRIHLIASRIALMTFIAVVLAATAFAGSSGGANPVGAAHLISLGNRSRALEKTGV